QEGSRASLIFCLYLHVLAIWRAPCPPGGQSALLEGRAVGQLNFFKEGNLPSRRAGQEGSFVFSRRAHLPSWRAKYPPGGEGRRAVGQLQKGRPLASRNPR